MDPRLLEKHLAEAIQTLTDSLDYANQGVIRHSTLRAIEKIQAARRELWQDKPGLEGAKP